MRSLLRPSSLSLFVTVQAILMSLSGCASDSASRSESATIASSPDISEATSARSLVAHRLALDAQASLNRNQPHEALRLASMAAQLDPRYADIEDEARAQVVDLLLQDAQTALDDGRPQTARLHAEQALQVDPQSEQATGFIRDLNESEIEILLLRVRDQQVVQNYAGARQTLQQILDLDPGNPAAIALNDALAAAENQAQFMRISRETENHLAHGRLVMAEESIRMLRGIAPSDLPEPEYSQGFEQLSRQVESQSREARDLYDAGLTALREGRVNEATSMLTRAKTLDSSLNIDVYLRDASFSAARERFVAAMEAGNRLGALLAARELLERRDDPEIASLIPQLEEAYVAGTIREVERRKAAGDIKDARTLLEGAMQHVTHPDLEAALAALEVD